MKIGKTRRKKLEDYTRHLFIHRQKDRREKKRWLKGIITKGRREETICA